MGKVVDLASILLLVGAAVAFSLGVRALQTQQDLLALYWLVIGALALRSSTDLLRPKSSSR